MYHNNCVFSWNLQRITKIFHKNMCNVLTFLYFCTWLQACGNDVWWGGWSCEAGHYIAEKRHTMLCRLAIWNYHKKMCVKDNAELMSRVCWIHIPSCAWGLTMPSTHTNGFISIAFVGITLLVNTQGCGRPQIADGQKVDTHVFRCVVPMKR